MSVIIQKSSNSFQIVHENGRSQAETKIQICMVRTLWLVIEFNIEFNRSQQLCKVSTIYFSNYVPSSGLKTNIEMIKHLNIY